MRKWSEVDPAALTLRSQRLVLRPWQPADAAAVAAIMRDVRMSEFLPLPRPYTAQDARDFVAAAAHRPADTGRLELAVQLGDQVIGAIGIAQPDPDGGAEIGYWIGSEHWGAGYATEAVRVLAEYGFAHGLNRLEIQTDVSNLGSVKVALRAGFRYEGTARLGHRSQHGPADHAMFGRLATDPGHPVPPAWSDPPDLTDGVVRLRPVQPADWPVLLAEASNPEARRWGLFSGAPPQQIMLDRARTAGLNWLVGRSVELLITEVGTGDGAGAVNLRAVGPPDVVALGYGVLPAFRRRRFTSRALRLVADWAFSQTPIVRLELGCKADNLASLRSAELAGFVRDGRFASRLRNPDGSYSDEIGFGLVRPAG